VRPAPRAAAPLLAIATLLACATTPASAIAATFGVIRDVRVPTVPDPSVTVDVWKPRRTRSARPRPVALLVHGGGWHTGDKRQWEQSRWAQRLAARGWIVVNANYRLACTRPGQAPDEPAAASAPEAEAAAALERAGDRVGMGRNARLCGHAMRTSIADVRATLRYVARSAHAWGGDERRIVLFGASAGAQLAMLAGSDKGRPAGVRAGIALSPPTDLVWVGRHPELPLYGSASLSIGCGLDACADAWHRASPIRQARGRVTPPTWLFAAGGDTITPFAPVSRYASRLRSLGVAATLVTTSNPGETCHGPLPCAGAPLAGSSLDLFEHAQRWLRPRIR
jgi:acetyl esterase/lipase